MPTATKNKVKFGLKNVYYAPITAFSEANTPTYGTPVRYPGAVNLSLDPEGERTVFYADDIEYWEDPGNRGYSGDFEAAITPDEFLQDILGEVVDPNGLQYDDLDAPTIHFALLYEIDGDVKKTRHVLYNCTAGHPGVGGQTKEESTEPVTDSISLNARGAYFAAVDKNVAHGKLKRGDTGYDSFFTAVVTPAAGTTSA